MNVLDLYSGLKGWAQPFADRGHKTFTIDINPVFDADLHADMRKVEPSDIPFKPDIILASPPCQAFTVAQIGRNWHGSHGTPLTPKTPLALLGQELVIRTFYLIHELKPKFWVIENPRAALRKMIYMTELERRTVTYCQYGEHRMKPTDLWGGFPPSLELKPPCSNGASCHVRAPRGSTTGTQGMKADLAAKIPYPLALDVCLATERDLDDN